MAREIALFLEGKCILSRARCQIWENNVSEDGCVFEGLKVNLLCETEKQMRD